MPTAIAKLHGVRKSRINDAEPEPRDIAPVRPVTLTPLARAEWDRVIPDLIAMGVAKAVDQAALSGYCEAVALCTELSQAIRREGVICYNVEGDLKSNPLVTQFLAAQATLVKWAREFGFTPSARTGVKVQHSHNHTVTAPDRLLT